MNRLEFNTIVAKRCESINKTLIEKGREYANDDEVFHNFKNAAGISFHGSHEKVAWEFMVKHLQSIKDIIEHVSIDGANGYPKEYLVEEKIGDAINYLILIEGMLKERVQQYNKL
jgi:hypothetical protein